MPTSYLVEQDRYSTTVRQAPRNVTATANASDPVVYQSTTPYWQAQGKSDVVTTWTFTAT